MSEKISEKNPIRFVERLALRKALATAKTLNKGIVLGADTIVVWRKKILGKPKDAEDAFRMLSKLSGTTNVVYTGIALVDAASGRKRVAHARSEVRMKTIPSKQIRKLSRRHLDKAGAYAIQEKRDPIARVVKGSYDNVVGLPVEAVKALLKKLSQAV